MKRVMAACAALMLCGLVQPASAERITTELTGFRNKSEWTMFQSFKNDVCTATINYVKNTNLLLLWYPRTEKLMVKVTDPVLESIKEGTKYDVEVVFKEATGFDEGWGTVSATGSTDSDDVPAFTLYLSGNEALQDFSMSSGVSFWYKKKLVDSLTLGGSALMVSELRRCATEIIKNHPIDPFES